MLERANKIIESLIWSCRKNGRVKVSASFYSATPHQRETMGFPFMKIQGLRLEPKSFKTRTRDRANWWLFHHIKTKIFIATTQMKRERGPTKSTLSITKIIIQLIPSTLSSTEEMAYLVINAIKIKEAINKEQIKTLWDTSNYKCEYRST